MDPQSAVDRMFKELSDLRSTTHDDLQEFAKGNTREHNRIYDKMDNIVGATASNAKAIAVLVKEITVLHAEHRLASVDRAGLRKRLDDIDSHLTEERGRLKAKTVAMGAGGGGALLVIAEILKHLFS